MLFTMIWISVLDLLSRIISILFLFWVCVGYSLLLFENVFCIRLFFMQFSKKIILDAMISNFSYNVNVKWHFGLTDSELRICSISKGTLGFYWCRIYHGVWDWWIILLVILVLRVDEHRCVMSTKSTYMSTYTVCTFSCRNLTWWWFNITMVAGVLLQLLQ
jgi:hypothetical protein